MEALLVLYLISLFGDIPNSAQQMIGFSSCPDHEGLIENFDITKYVGIWYEQYRYFIIPEIGSICTHVNVTHSEEGGLIYQIQFLNSWSRDFETISGLAKIDGPEGHGKFTINFKNGGNFSMIYRMIDTDYDSFAVIWSCENKRGYNIQNVLIFTREQFPTQETMSKVAIALKKNKLPETFYTKIDQTSCGQVDIEINPEAEYIDVEESTDVEEI